MPHGARDLAALPRRFQRATPVAGLRVVGPPLGQAFHKRCAGKISLLAPCAASDHAIWLPMTMRFPRSDAAHKLTASAGRSRSPSSEIATDTNGDPAGWSMRLPQARFATRRGLANAIRSSG